MPNSCVEITEVTKQFSSGVRALDGVTLSVPSGQFVVLLGPSGAGKSTLLRMVNGLERPTRGSITVHGEPVVPARMLRIRRHVGMVFQHFNLVGRLNVATNVLVGRLAHQSALGRVLSWLYLFPREDLALARRALLRVGLEGKMWERADQLSGGQQQRVGIARVLVQQPRLVLADEPVASLDPVTGEEIMELLSEICAGEGLTVIASLHQVQIARRYADRIIGLAEGRVVFDGPPEELTDEALARVYGRAPERVAGAAHAPVLIPEAVAGSCSP